MAALYWTVLTNSVRHQPRSVDRVRRRPVDGSSWASRRAGRRVPGRTVRWTADVTDLVTTGLATRTKNRSGEPDQDGSRRASLSWSSSPRRTARGRPGRGSRREVGDTVSRPHRRRERSGP
jgi:hypothetical protein